MVYLINIQIDLHNGEVSVTWKLKIIKR